MQDVDSVQCYLEVFVRIASLLGGALVSKKIGTLGREGSGMQVRNLKLFFLFSVAVSTRASKAVSNEVCAQR